MECLKVEACELTYTKIIKIIIMTSDFMPIPEIGVKYVKPNGDIIKVTNFYQNNGGVPDYVEYIELSDNSIGEAPMEDWNNLNLTPVDDHIDGKTSVEVLVGKPTPVSVDVTIKTTNIKEFAYILDQDSDATFILVSGTKVEINDPTIVSEKVITIHSLEPNTSHKVYFAFRQSDNNIYGEVKIEEFTTSNANDEEKKEQKTSNEDKDPYKVKELEALLNNGPKYINPNYFPLDFANDLPQNEMVETDAEEAFQKTINEINQKRRVGRKLKCGCVNEVLWTCAGVDKPLLRMSPTDWSKKAGVGGVILGTGLLATLSGGYAMYTVFDSWLAAVIIGLFWGLIIFNFDRYLVNSMVSDGTAKITKDEFYSALPRIIIAIFLGVVISAPIEIKLFEGNINEVLEKSENIFVEEKVKKALSEYELKLNKYKKDYEDAVKEEQIALLRMSIEEGGFVYDPNQTDGYQRDDKGEKIRNRRGNGYGDRAQELDKEKRAKADTTSTKKKIYDDFLINSAKEKENLISQATKNAKDEFKKQAGLIKKYEILQNLTEFYTDEPSGNKSWWKFWERDINGMYWVKLVITLLFIILEIMPVFAKMMQEAGWYDKWINLEDQTMEQLARVKEYNHINVLKTGNLSIYLKQILGHDIIDEDNEGNRAFVKTNTTKQKKDETEAANLEIYGRAIQRHKDFVLSCVDKIYGDVTINKTKHNVSSDDSKDNDASDDAIKIS